MINSLFVSRFQVTELIQPPKPPLTSVVARPKRRAPPLTIQDMHRFPEIVPVQEVIPEETAESMTPASEEKGRGHKQQKH